MNMPMTIDRTGSQFIVLIFYDYVMKIPRGDDTDLDTICKHQQELALQFPEILPAYNYNTYIFQLRAKGTRLDELEKHCSQELWECIWEKRNALVTKLRDAGYNGYDINTSNTFYDTCTGELSVVDVLYSPVQVHEVTVSE